MRSKQFIITGAVIATIAMCGPLTAFAAPKKESASPSPSPAAKPSPAANASGTPAQKPRAIPFHGVATSVDQSARTFTIQGKTNARVFKVTDNSAVTKAGASATLADLNANDAVSGTYWKQADGSLETKSLKIGGAGGSSSKKAKKDASAEASPAASPSASPKK